MGGNTYGKAPAITLFGQEEKWANRQVGSRVGNTFGKSPEIILWTNGHVREWEGIQKGKNARLSCHSASLVAYGNV